MFCQTRLPIQPWDSNIRCAITVQYRVHKIAYFPRIRDAPPTCVLLLEPSDVPLACDSDAADTTERAGDTSASAERDDEDGAAMAADGHAANGIGDNRADDGTPVARRELELEPEPSAALSGCGDIDERRFEGEQRGLATNTGGFCVTMCAVVFATRISSQPIAAEPHGCQQRVRPKTAGCGRYVSKEQLDFVLSTDRYASVHDDWQEGTRVRLFFEKSDGSCGG